MHVSHDTTPPDEMLAHPSQMLAKISIQVTACVRVLDSITTSIIIIIHTHLLFDSPREHYEHYEYYEYDEENGF